jgi:DNA polymerase-3 subunit gamma/tau
LLSLARKYRPRRFAEVAVQTHVSNTLRGAIARGRVAHGYLLCGPRGTGKTTLARVLAMALNCEQRAESGEPCGTCSSCTRIWAGSSSLDVVEIDAASNRGVDDARELRERAMYAPSGESRWKVYIIDEAHMLTREAWNALLKILEEPPPRVVFVFATTEAHKIAQFAAPVLSRLQRFDFKRIGAAEVRARLTAVLEAEKVEADEDALAMIGRAADGSMRDALSLADQVLAFHEGRVTADAVREALGLVAEDEQLAMLDLVAERKAGEIFGAVTRLADQGVDLGLFLAGFGDIVRAQLAIELGGDPGDLSDRTRHALAERKGRLPAGDLLRMLSSLAELEPRFRRSTQQQLLLETILVRFALLDRTVAIEEVLRGMGSSGGGGAPAERAASRGGTASRRTGFDAAPTETPASVPRVREGAAPSSPSRMRAATPVSGVAVDVVSLASAAGPALAERSTQVSAADLNAVAGVWDDMVAAMRRDRPYIATLLEQAFPVSATATGVLTLQVESPAAQESLAARSSELSSVMATWLLGLQRIAVRFAGDTTAPPAGRMTVESVRTETVAALRKRDPLLAAAIDALDLDLVE